MIRGGLYMIWNWMTFALDAARLGRDTQEVMALRLLKLTESTWPAAGAPSFRLVLLPWR